MNLMANQFLEEFSLTEQSSISMVNIVDKEEVEQPEETSMLLWDHDPLRFLLWKREVRFNWYQMTLPLSKIQEENKQPITQKRFLSPKEIL